MNSKFNVIITIRLYFIILNDLINYYFIKVNFTMYLINLFEIIIINDFLDLDYYLLK